MRVRELAVCIGVVLCGSFASFAQADDSPPQQGFDHVLLISVDGMHALDAQRYIQAHPGSALAELASHGTTFTNASTPSLSDSFPGLLALVTGGSPVSHGMFYDVSYDRQAYDPTNTTCSGSPGNWVAYDETIDLYTSANVSLNVIDPAMLPRKRDANGTCKPVYPHSAVQANTIFEVVRSARGFGLTAWADKHPAYDLVNGPSGTGVADLYTPEITNNNGFDATVSVVCTVDNDQLKVTAVLNEIHGFRHDGRPLFGGFLSAPTLFGMNFQAVSVGQKLALDNRDGSCAAADSAGMTGKAGGYLDSAGTPSDVLSYGLDKTDAALASMIAALKAEKLYDSTLFIVSAKHGQSPINPAKVNKPGHFADLVAALPDAGTNPAALAIANAANCTTGPCGFVQDDDVALIWLQDQSQTQAVANYLNANAQGLFIDQVLSGDSLKLKFNDPAQDNKTPDLIVQPIYGTIYTHSSKKNAEHGGMSFGDTNVALIVSNPSLHAQTVKTPVATSQVAPTIVAALGLDPQSLHSVQVEHTQVLPNVLP